MKFFDPIPLKSFLNHLNTTVCVCWESVCCNILWGGRVIKIHESEHSIVLSSSCSHSKIWFNSPCVHTLLGTPTFQATFPLIQSFFPFPSFSTFSFFPSSLFFFLNFPHPSLSKAMMRHIVGKRKPFYFG